MVVCITGASGLVGSELTARLKQAGHEVLAVSRSRDKAGVVHWDPARGELDADTLRGVDAVVHLAGENIASGRWTEARKARIRSSRVQGTRLIAETIARMSEPPATLISASAIGYYGDRGNEVCTESSPPGEGFLADVCREWEAACDPAEKAGVRVCKLRIGVVLDRKGGALAKMLTPFRFGLGGIVGSGRQYWSWITLEDLTGMFQFLLDNPQLSGVFNAVAPEPVTNKEFTRTLGRVLRVPTLFPLPPFLARMALGEMADALLLASTRVVPERMQQAGFNYRHPVLEEALRSILS